MRARPDASRTWLGVDLGTSAVKALFVDGHGDVLAEASRPLSLAEPEALAAEQDAASWWTAARDAIREGVDQLAGRPLDAVGLTGQKHALLLLDGAGRPLAPALLWADGRAGPWLGRVAELAPALAEETGAPPLAGYVLPKWLRLAARSPALTRRAKALCFAKDYLRLRLTGTRATDPTEAVASQLWDRAHASWSDARARAFGLPSGLLPATVRPWEVAGRVTAAAARETGIGAGTPVVGGAGDNECAALGLGVVHAGRAAVLLGTSGTVVAPVAGPRVVPGLVHGPHAAPSTDVATGTLLSCGRALAWAARVLAVGGGGAVEALLEAAGGEAVRGVSTPVFLPALAGERSPVPDATATGAFVGLLHGHTAAHLARAVVEGVAGSLGQVVGLFGAAGARVAEVAVSSGGARTPLLPRLVLAAARLPGLVVADEHVGARGAALLARAGVEGTQDLAEAARLWVRHAEPWSPPAEDLAHMARVMTGLDGARRALGVGGQAG